MAEPTKFPPSQFNELRENDAVLRGLRTGKNPVYFKKEKFFVEAVTSAHPDPKVAALAELFAEMLDHPLAKRFLRKKPRLYLALSSDTDVNVPRVFIANDKHIFVNEAAIKAHTLAELKYSVGHEIGHAMALDGNFRRKAVRKHTPKRDQEYLADQIALILSQEPEAARTWQATADRARRNALREAGYDREAEMANTGGGPLDLTTGLPLYPSWEERISAIDKALERMKTAEGRTSLEAELADRMETIHRELFPHHYNRNSGITRG